MNQQQKDAARVEHMNRRAAQAADKPAESVTIDLGGERAGIVAALRRGNETPRQTIARLIDAARPQGLDIGQSV